MRFSARHRSRRGNLALVLACLATGPFLAGCAEDRSNLIPAETSEMLIAQLDQVQSLADSGKCFEAAAAAAEAQQEIEAMGPEVDAELKRSLLDGVTDLTLMTNDPDKCEQTDSPATEDPPETDEVLTEPEGTTGATGTTGPDPTTTGEQGETGNDQDSGESGNGSGNTPPETPPVTNPAPPTTPSNPSPPTTPSTPPSTGPGSGGLGPGG